MKKILLAGASALMLSTPAAVMADEGMWLPSQTGAIAAATSSITSLMGRKVDGI